MKEVLLAVDPFVAYEQFVNRRLLAGESPDMYLAELWCLASLFDGMTNKAFACGLVA